MLKTQTGSLTEKRLCCTEEIETRSVSFKSVNLIIGDYKLKLGEYRENLSEELNQSDCFNSPTSIKHLQTVRIVIVLCLFCFTIFCKLLEATMIKRKKVKTAAWLLAWLLRRSIVILNTLKALLNFTSDIWQKSTRTPASAIPN